LRARARLPLTAQITVAASVPVMKNLLTVERKGVRGRLRGGVFKVNGVEPVRS
jgi:hypothetical protein